MIINEENKAIYKKIYQQKDLTESIIGITDYTFEYAVASYQAVCTEGIDFTMFDKVICSILQIDEVSGFEAIADILGLNVVHRPEEGKFIDLGEKEVLAYAIKSLIDFKMIETDDTHYSRCRLTEIGKSYAQQGKKFLPATSKDFKIYYDLTDRKHHEAKKRFAKFAGVLQANRIDFDVADESFVKTIAAIQTPEIYSPDNLRNFTNLKLQMIEPLQVTFQVVGLFDITNNAVRLVAFDEKQNLCPIISDMIAANMDIKHQIIEEIVSQHELIVATNKTDAQQQYEAKIVQEQQNIAHLLAQKQHEKAFEQVKAAYLGSNIIEKPYFELNFSDFFDVNSTEFWIIIPHINPHFFNEIKIIIEQKATFANAIFIITTNDIATDMNLYFNAISIAAPNVFWAVADKIKTPIFLFKNGVERKAILQEYIQLTLTSKTTAQAVYTPINEWHDYIAVAYKQRKSTMAAQYFALVSEKIIQQISGFAQNPNLLSRKAIDDFDLYCGRLSVFKNDKALSIDINKFYKTNKEKVAELKILLFSTLKNQITDFESAFLIEETNYSITELREFEDKLQELKNNLYDENAETIIKINDFEKQIKNQIQALSTLQSVTPAPQTQNTQSRKRKRKR